MFGGGGEVNNRQKNLIHLQVLIESYAPFLLIYKNEKEKNDLSFMISFEIWQYF